MRELAEVSRPEALPISGPAFTAETGQVVCLGQQEGDLLFLDASTGRTAFTLHAPGSPIRSAAVSRDGTRVVTGSADGTIRVWDVLSGRLLVARELDSPVQAVAFAPDGSFLFCGNGNTTCYQFEFKKLLEA